MRPALSIRAWRHRFRVTFEDAPARDVTAQTEEAAKRTAEAAQRVVGFKRGPACRAVTVQDLGHVGTDGDRCDRCGLFAGVK